MLIWIERKKLISIFIANIEIEKNKQNQYYEEKAIVILPQHTKNIQIYFASLK